MFKALTNLNDLGCENKQKCQYSAAWHRCHLYECVRVEGVQIIWAWSMEDMRYIDLKGKKNQGENAIWSHHGSGEGGLLLVHEVFKERDTNAAERQLLSIPFKPWQWQQQQQMTTSKATNLRIDLGHRLISPYKNAWYGDISSTSIPGPWLARGFDWFLSFRADHWGRLRSDALSCNFAMFSLRSDPILDAAQSLDEFDVAMAGLSLDKRSVADVQAHSKVASTLWKFVRDWATALRILDVALSMQATHYMGL